MSKSSRALVFAKGAIKKGLSSRAQAEECLAVYRKMRRRGKDISIEEVFVRKRVMGRAEASALARRIRPAQAATSPKLDLVPVAAECPNCSKDPGDGEDCFRCGALLATGAPGPRAASCGSCGLVVLKGTALCPRCARKVDDVPRGLRRRQSSSRGKALLDRLILVATLAGMGWFIHHHAFAEPKSPPTGELMAQPGGPEPPAVAKARAFLKKGDPEEAVRTLQEALESSEGIEKLELQKALAMIGPTALAARAAEAALEESPNDPLLLQRVAGIALERGEPKVALNYLRKIPELSRDDSCWRLVAGAQRSAGANWIEPLLKVEERTGLEARLLALALIERGRGHRKNNRKAQALRDLRRARQVDPDLAGAHLALGLYLLEQERYEEARRSLREAIRRDSAPAAPWLALGLVMDAQGKSDAARANYQQFIRLAGKEGGHEERIKRVEARLKALRRN